MNSNAKIYEMLTKGNVEKALEYLKENIYEEENKKSGRKASDISIIKRGLKQSKNQTRFLKQHVVTGTDLKALICGGYYVLFSKDFNIETIEKEQNFDCKNMIDACNLNNRTTIQIDVSDLKAFNKLNKADKKPYVVRLTLSDGKKTYIAFNGWYVLDCLEFCKTDCITIDLEGGFKHHVYKSPMYIEGVENDAICLPININLDDDKPIAHQSDVIIYHI